MANDNPAPNPTPNPEPAPAPTPNPNPTPAPKTYDEEYVKELRHGERTWKGIARENETKRAEAEQRATAAEEAANVRAKAAEDAAEAKRVEVETRARNRIVNAEVRTAAIEAGMVDLDGIKLLDLSKVKVSDDGDVDVASVKALLTEMKEAKAYLFGPPRGTGNPNPTPVPTPPGDKSVKELSKAEYDAAKRAAIRGK